MLKACLGLVALSLTTAVTSVALTRLVELTHSDIEQATDRAVERARLLVANERRLAYVERQVRREARALVVAAEWECFQAAPRSIA